ncbi:hypothetical protein CAPTEDRAFT_19242 [Capitella teleta]|uniref:CWH43-like N-terminal domain-containing protein n=1 Tax=Capitella teleta TaxID=283909 RepID=R7UHI7_CAPTE|nr:hypothetical protein CAPTEDRAFT_19242 [Capitella teleta]|eukprot:ELU02737.1 hypothetical protein CAPTEDRAFT_19242 [Capitella teleta]
MPTVETVGNQQVVFKLSGSNLAKIVLSLPIGGFFACLLLSLMYDWHESTATHCGVVNYLPSISSAIGGFTPQRYIWRICIALHCAPRFMIAVMYFNFYLSSKALLSAQRFYNTLVWVNMLLNISENFFLILLTCVSSTENYLVHERSFILFIIASECHMLLSLLLNKWSKSYRPLSRKEVAADRKKLAMFLANLMACLLAGYFFYRHNKFCEAGIYTYFAACEYTVVLTNIAFHGCAVYDFGHGAISFMVPMHKD